MDTATVDSRIVPYSPMWFKLHAENFTASDAWRLMTDPRGKSPKQRYEDHGVKLAQLEAKFHALAPEKMGLKSSLALKAKIEKAIGEYKVLEERKNDIHLSDTAETYILKKVHGKLSGINSSGVDNMATQWGVENEPKAKYWYSKVTGRELLEAYLVLHPEIEGYSCTPDAPVLPCGLVEIKCPFDGSNHLKHWLISSDEYMKENHPDKYWQMISQMNITGEPWCDFVSFDPRINNDKGLFIYRLNYNEEDGTALETRVKAARSLFNDYYSLFSK